MHEQAFTIAIKPEEESQLDVLEHEFSPDNLSNIIPYAQSVIECFTSCCTS